MVGRVFRVIITMYAQRRRRQVFDFEEDLNGTDYARKVQQMFDEEMKRLENLPEAHPLYLDHIQLKFQIGKSNQHDIIHPPQMMFIKV